MRGRSCLLREMSNFKGSKTFIPFSFPIDPTVFTAHESANACVISLFGRGCTRENSASVVNAIIDRELDLGSSVTVSHY